LGVLLGRIAKSSILSKQRVLVASGDKDSSITIKFSKLLQKSIFTRLSSRVALAWHVLEKQIRISSKIDNIRQIAALRKVYWNPDYQARPKSLSQKYFLN
jgi:hypothetical protein